MRRGAFVDASSESVPGRGGLTQTVTIPGPFDPTAAVNAKHDTDSGAALKRTRASPP